MSHRGAVGKPPGSGGILIVAPRGCRFSPEGATSIDLHIAEIVRASRHRPRITVAAPAVADPFPGIRHIPWDAQRRGRARDRTLAAIAQEEAPALIVVHQHLGTAAGLARHLPGTPVALIRHNYVKPPGRGPLGWLSARLQAARFARLAGLGFVSPALLEAFRAGWCGQAHPLKGPLPLFLTPNGIDTDLWQPQPKRDRLLFTGRLAPEKGVREAAEATVRLLAMHPGWEAVFVLDSREADPAYAATVRQTLAPLGRRVAIHENIAHEAVRALVATSAVALVPTQAAEPFGRVALEAMATGAAVVASAAGGLGPLVEGAGITLETPDTPALVAAAGPLMADEQARRRLATTARARAERWNLAAAGQAFDTMADRLSPALHPSEQEKPGQ
ncbi:MAG: glycosyltransferase family 4 protein [Pseudomonadota bacterium]